MNVQFLTQNIRFGKVQLRYENRFTFKSARIYSTRETERTRSDLILFPSAFVFS